MPFFFHLLLLEAYLGLLAAKVATSSSTATYVTTFPGLFKNKRIQLLKLNQRLQLKLL